MCYDENQNRDRKASEFETPPNATSFRQLSSRLQLNWHQIRGPKAFTWHTFRSGIVAGREDMSGLGCEREVGIDVGNQVSKL